MCKYVCAVCVCALNDDFFAFQVFYPRIEKDFESTLEKVLAEYASFATLEDQDAVAERKVCFYQCCFIITDTYFRTKSAIGWSRTFSCANKITICKVFFKMFLVF